MTIEKINVAIIGAGFISDYHIDGIRAAGGAQITTLVGRTEDKTRQRALDFDIPDFSTDYQTVLADSNIQAVVIATPDATHLPIATKALEAGKDVLLQKPMAMTSDQCREIIAAASKSSGRLSVSFMHRYFPEVRWLSRALQQNRFGRIHSIRLRNATPGAGWAEWFYDPQMVAGGVVMQLGVHGIDLVQHLFGPIASVMAVTSTMQPARDLDDGRIAQVRVEDNAQAIYRLASGIHVTHEMSWTEVAGCDRFRLEVYFEDATVWLRSQRASVLFSHPGAVGSEEWQMADVEDTPLGQAHHRHWLQSVSRTADEDDTARAGLSSMIVGEHIYESSRRERMIQIGEQNATGKR